MRSSRRGKTAALLAGLGALAVLGAGLASWRDLAVRWHLWRLASDPGLLLEHATSPEGSLRRDAARAFVRTPVGGEALVAFVLRESRRVNRILDAVLASGSGHSARSEVTPGLSLEWVRSASGGYCRFWYDPETLGEVAAFGVVPVKEVPAVRGVQALLAEVVDSDVTLRQYPGLRFTMLRREEQDSAGQAAEKLRKLLVRLGNRDFEAPPYVCLIRRAPSAGAGQQGPLTPSPTPHRSPPPEE
ncbi:MAG: hypothetical protein HY721_30535 [Planctomycetes bacterium]|nr:hypothetical protein [Planctomycetota bacterium]